MTQNALVPTIGQAPAVMSVELSITQAAVVPAMIEDAGAKAKKKFVEFFTDIDNENTRAAYLRAFLRFSQWCEQLGISLAQVEPALVAAYKDQMKKDTNPRTGRPYAIASIKQHLAAIRTLFDALVVGQIVPVNPAASVRGPKLVVKKGKTPVLPVEDVRRLLDSIPTEGLVNLRDRAFVATTFFCFGRVSAVLAMKVEDYCLLPHGRRKQFRLHEKGNTYLEIPAHHKAEEYMEAYLAAAGIGNNPLDPLFPAATRERTLTNMLWHRRNALDMMKRRARRAGVSDLIGNHTMRASGITNFRKHEGTLERAQKIAGHSSPRTTSLYDHSEDELTEDDIERNVF